MLILDISVLKLAKRSIRYRSRRCSKNQLQRLEDCNEECRDTLDGKLVFMEEMLASTRDQMPEELLRTLFF